MSQELFFENPFTMCGLHIGPYFLTTDMEHYCLYKGVTKKYLVKDTIGDLNLSNTFFQACLCLGEDTVVDLLDMCMDWDDHMPKRIYPWEGLMIQYADLIDGICDNPPRSDKEIHQYNIAFAAMHRLPNRSIYSFRILANCVMPILTSFGFTKDLSIRHLAVAQMLWPTTPRIPEEMVLGLFNKRKLRNVIYKHAISLLHLTQTFQTIITCLSSLDDTCDIKSLIASELDKFIRQNGGTSITPKPIRIMYFVDIMYHAILQAWYEETNQFQNITYVTEIADKNGTSSYLLALAGVCRSEEFSRRYPELHMEMRKLYNQKVSESFTPIPNNHKD